MEKTIDISTYSTLIIKHESPKKRVGVFEKVSYEEYKRAMLATYPLLQNEEKNLKAMYDAIQLPTRKTKGAAGYDFMMPFTVYMYPGTRLMVPTGIRVKITDPTFALFMLPRSGIGSATGIRIMCTIGLIDSDYYGSDNEGHIMIRMEYGANITPALGHSKWGAILDIVNEKYTFEQGKGFCQGVFLDIGFTNDDDTDNKPDRNGGFGSTDNPSEPLTPIGPTLPILPSPNDDGGGKPQEPAPPSQIQPPKEDPEQPPEPPKSGSPQSDANVGVDDGTVIVPPEDDTSSKDKQSVPLTPLTPATEINKAESSPSPSQPEPDKDSSGSDGSVTDHDNVVIPKPIPRYRPKPPEDSDEATQNQPEPEGSADTHLGNT